MIKNDAWERIRAALAPSPSPSDHVAEVSASSSATPGLVGLGPDVASPSQVARLSAEDIRPWPRLSNALAIEEAGREGQLPDEYRLTAVERFVHEYEDADEVRAEWFRKRLVEMVNGYLDERTRKSGVPPKMDEQAWGRKLASKVSAFLLAFDRGGLNAPVLEELRASLVMPDGFVVMPDGTRMAAFDSGEDIADQLARPSGMKMPEASKSQLRRLAVMQGEPVPDLRGHTSTTPTTGPFKDIEP